MNNSRSPTQQFPNTENHSSQSTLSVSNLKWKKWRNPQLHGGFFHPSSSSCGLGRVRHGISTQPWNSHLCFSPNNSIPMWLSDTHTHTYIYDPGGLGNPHGVTVCPDQYYSIYTQVLAALEATAAIQTGNGWTQGGGVYKLNPIKKQWLSGANIDPVFPQTLQSHTYDCLFFLQFVLPFDWQHPEERCCYHDDSSCYIRVFDEHHPDTFKSAADNDMRVIIPVIMMYLHL